MLPLGWPTSGNGCSGPSSRLRQLGLSHVSRRTAFLGYRDEAEIFHGYSYHQDVKDWYFGKLSALREISLAVEGGYQSYYMGVSAAPFPILFGLLADETAGFYIHSCIKMRYKNQYQPSYVLGH